MAKSRRASAQPEPFDQERWLARFVERTRPAIWPMLAVFDACPRRPDDEEQWRAALVDEILEGLQDAYRSGYLGGEGEHAVIENRVLVLFDQVEARINAALAERQGGAGASEAQA